MIEGDVGFASLRCAASVPQYSAAPLRAKRLGYGYASLIQPLGVCVTNGCRLTTNDFPSRHIAFQGRGKFVAAGRRAAAGFAHQAIMPVNWA